MKKGTLVLGKADNTTISIPVKNHHPYVWEGLIRYINDNLKNPKKISSIIDRDIIPKDNCIYVRLAPYFPLKVKTIEFENRESLNLFVSTLIVGLITERFVFTER